MKGTLGKSSLYNLLDKTPHLENRKVRNIEMNLNLFPHKTKEDLFQKDKIQFQKERLSTLLKHHSSSSKCS